MRKKQNKREDAAKRANRTVFWRTVLLMCIFGACLFIPLFIQLFRLQIVQHEELQQKATDQQTLDQSVSAARGTIYDRNGNVLAMSATVYNVILSPRELDNVQARYQESVEDGKTPDYDYPSDELVAAGLSEILDVDMEEILERCQRDSAYQIVATGVEGDMETQVREFITESHLSNSVYLTPSTKRYYPYSDLAAQVIGFVNASGGAYGVESKYEDLLKGEAGRVVTAKSAKGVSLPNFFEDYLDATDGYDITLTLDKTIQSLVEKELEKRIAMYDVQKGGFCIVMDANSGAILAMASSPDYDLNNYSAVVDQVLQETLAGLDPNSEAYSDALGNARLKQWSNKALNTSYEPGSTFKSIVLAAALEEGLEHKVIKHILNTGGIERFTEYQMDMVRLGIGCSMITWRTSASPRPPASICPGNRHRISKTAAPSGPGRASGLLSWPPPPSVSGSRPPRFSWSGQWRPR